MYSFVYVKNSTINLLEDNVLGANEQHFVCHLIDNDGLQQNAYEKQTKD